MFKLKSFQLTWPYAETINVDKIEKNTCYGLVRTLVGAVFSLQTSLWNNLRFHSHE